MLYLLLAALAYILGSIPFGKLVGLRHGIDIQKVGSGNIGFANAVRTLGWRPALPVLVGDVLKGLVPTLLAQTWLEGPDVLVVGALAVVGHIFPVWLRFNGGKGIATGLGVMLALDPGLVVPIGLVYLGGFAVFRKSAPASLLAAWILPLLCLWLSPTHSWFYAALAVLVTWAHRGNIGQLRREGLRAA